MSNEQPRRTPCHVLTDEEVTSVRESSLTVLEEVGIVIEHPKALSLYAEAGADINWDSHLAKIPAWLVDRVLRTVPSEFPITGQHPPKELVLGHNSRPRGRPVISLDWIVDPKQTVRRQVTVNDFEAWVRVSDALPNLCMVSGVYPWDVPLETRDLRVAEAILRLSEKPILIAPSLTTTSLAPPAS